MKQIGLVLLSILIALLRTGASPAQADVAIRKAANSGLYSISIFGKIDESAVKGFLNAIDDPRIKSAGRPILLHLNSPGGSLSAAISIGEIVRRETIATSVIDNAQCVSACVFILAAGVWRSVGDKGKVGIHRPRFDEEYFASLTLEQARRKYNEMAMVTRQYLTRMGISDALYAAMLRVPSDRIEVLPWKVVREFGLDGEDPSWSEYMRATAIKQQGRETYDVNQSYFRALVACWNALSASADTCNELKSVFESALAHLMHANA